MVTAVAVGHAAQDEQVTAAVLPDRIAIFSILKAVKISPYATAKAPATLRVIKTGSRMINGCQI